ncbi:MAG: isoamylase [Treponema sp.]|nr:isoamylase [Treponema sp.]
MKRFILAAFAAAVCLLPLSAKDADPPDTYEYDTLIASIKGVSAPYISGDFIVFTAKRNSRYVGIAFDFEGYKKIHTFQLHKTISYEGDITDSWFFYVLEKPKKLAKISYRLIIDGLWTTDPTNPNKTYNVNDAIELSYVDLPVLEDYMTEVVPEGFTRFICHAPTGQKVRLAGTFTNWDSWIYEMTEVQQGKYMIDLPLPAGTYYYAYYTGMTAFSDGTNPTKGYSSDGKIVSCITVQ